jgi:glucosamine--fructose-6-phosphate aminotransferase (isomerizing)
MCGIIAVLGREPSRTPPDPAAVARALDQLAAGFDASDGGPPGGQQLAALAGAAAALDRDLRGVPGLRTLLAHPDLVALIEERTLALQQDVATIEAKLDAGDLSLAGAELEYTNAALVSLKDALWALRQDRLRTARAVADLAGMPGPQIPAAASQALWAVQVALSALDRLEVRGRDSAGLQILVADHGLDLTSTELRTQAQARLADPLFTSLAVRTPDGHLSFVYKAAAEIGELGDNGAALRAAIASDPLFHRAIRSEAARVTVLCHTRWASVGIISQPNAHPVNQEEEDRTDGPFVTAALNGDVDNYLDLKLAEALHIPAEITTDAKIIPALISHRLADGVPSEDAVRSTVAQFDGSVAIAANVAAEPDRLYLALRGSGQGLYVGLAEDAYLVASEPYGLVEETSMYLRMDGESGQLIVLDRRFAGERAHVRRLTYAGAELPVEAEELHHAEITTRDIDRAGFPHYLLKEVTEAPQSFRKTLRGKITERDGLLAVELGEVTLPAHVKQRLPQVRHVVVIGQGTASVAGRSVAAAVGAELSRAGISVTSTLATELSGFQMEDDMSHTLVIAVSQSGTTTDTNRTVDLVRSRGAIVLAIVNRRNSDLVARADGVLYTSDGRDVEMSVPSTKAFYAQIAAGFLMALGLAGELGVDDRPHTHRLLTALRQLPEAMEEVLRRRETIASAAGRLAPARRYWAVVGNGTNRIAAEEVRIKLSELCYKSIACDATEDKKHIDLSSEPLILVCAAGLNGPTADDVAKEVAIYRAHKAAPIVIASDDEDRFAAAMAVLPVPACEPSVAFVLSAMAGHLFGYEAALAIDAQARPLRAGRAAIEEVIRPGDDRNWLEHLGPHLEEAAAPFFAGLRAGSYNGHLEAGTAVRLAGLLRYAMGAVPIEAYEVEYGKVGTPAAVIEDLTEALTAAIGELTRPIDAIKHQAKTVTVGISRSEDALLGVPLVAELLTTGAQRDRLSYRALRTLAELDLAVDAVTGYTRYAIDGRTISVIDQGGVAANIPSRTVANPELRGSKNRVAEEREVTVTRGRADGRTVILIPEVKDNQVTGIDLLHVRFHEYLAAEGMRRVMTGYRHRYNALVDSVTETEPVFRDELLATISVIDLLTLPVHVLADQWR